MQAIHSPAQIKELKRQAKRLARAKEIEHAEALDEVARDNGYDNWSLLMKNRQLEAAVTSPSLTFPKLFVCFPGYDISNIPPYSAMLLFHQPVNRDFVGPKRAILAYKAADKSQAVIAGDIVIQLLRRR